MEILSLLLKPLFQLAGALVGFVLFIAVPLFPLVAIGIFFLAFTGRLRRTEKVYIPAWIETRSCSHPRKIEPLPETVRQFLPEGEGRPATIKGPIVAEGGAVWDPVRALPEGDGAPATVEAAIMADGTVPRVEWNGGQYQVKYFH